MILPANFYDFSLISVLGLSFFKLIALLCGPFAVIKSLISLIHAYVACQDLGAIDVKERQEIRQQQEQGKKLE